jgi:phosphohistidine phosphatase
VKRLTVLRHAKSSWDHASLGDFDRPLNERGWKDARRIGKELKHRRMTFDLGLASPAARVRETIDGLIETYGEPTFPIHFDKRVYLAETSELFTLVRAIPDEAHAALLVGHNPGLEQLLVELGRDGNYRDRIAEKYPTAALAVVELPVKSWAEVGPGSGTITTLILPKELD